MKLKKDKIENELEYSSWDEYFKALEEKRTKDFINFIDMIMISFISSMIIYLFIIIIINFIFPE